VPLPATRKPLTANAVAAAPVEQVLRRLGSSADGLSSGEVGERLALHGPNAIRTHHVSAWAVLARQLNNAVLILLAITAVLSYFLGDHTQALIIGVILTASIGLGLFNEFRAEQAAAALHLRIRHTAIVRRDGRFGDADVRNLVPGDVIRRSLGQAVPADVRLIETAALQCDESYLLLRVAFARTVLILVTNLMLHRPLINSALFALAIAVSTTPQLLPAVVSTSLATGGRQLANAKVLVKQPVCTEDFGDIDIFSTDKTGTLTEGRISLVDTVNPAVM
jgi:magnesium-transporting ATPase (P-type)